MVNLWVSASLMYSIVLLVQTITSRIDSKVSRERYAHVRYVAEPCLQYDLVRHQRVEKSVSDIPSSSAIAAYCSTASKSSGMPWDGFHLDIKLGYFACRDSAGSFPPRYFPESKPPARMEYASKPTFRFEVAQASANSDSKRRTTKEQAFWMLAGNGISRALAARAHSHTPKVVSFDTPYALIFPSCINSLRAAAVS